MRVTELADKLRARGLTVVEVAGWQTRGNEFPTRPDGALRHWTAGPTSGNTPSLGVVTNGRSDLTGPLCNVYQSRIVDANGLDVVYVVAAGKANHAGEGSWNGSSGNYAFLGLEIEWAGPTENFLVRRRKVTSELVMRALLDCAAGTNVNDVAEHREYAPRRKIDTNLDGAEMRRRMAELANYWGETPDEEFDVNTAQKVDALYELLANGNPNFGAGTPPRWQVVLDNAIWNKERITTTYQGVIDVHEIAGKAAQDAAAAAMLATSCDRRLAAIMEHLGITEAPPVEPA